MIREQERGAIIPTRTDHGTVKAFYIKISAIKLVTISWGKGSNQVENNTRGPSDGQVDRIRAHIESKDPFYC